jgi:phosphoserine phosphatase RsbU/P
MTQIAKIASSFLHMEKGTPVYRLLEELREPYEHAVAIIDADGRVCGIIVPQDLVEILGKPFGRDFLKRQNVEDIMRDAVTFPEDEYIPGILDRIGGDLESNADCRYVLVDTEGKFVGHVTSRDILVYAMNSHLQELEVAATIQARLVPPCLTSRSESVSITCSSVMAQGVGGDYYYVREYLPGEWFFCLCDISGKGMSAAIITAALSGFMFNADFTAPLAVTLERLNRIIHDTFRLEKYLTGIFARFSASTGELEYCDMGHSFFFALDGSSVQQISAEADNVPLGLVADVKIVERVLRLAPGSTLLFLSDGFLEQEDRAGRTFGLDTLGSFIERSVSRGEDLVRAKIRILEAFFTFKKDVPQHDDISMLMFRYDDLKK